MTDDRCIYCSPDRPVQATFSNEHVIPQAFGRFRNNLVLNRGVCTNCNQFFGDHLELVFARGSWESLLRLNYRIRPAEQVSELRRDRIRCTLATDDEFDGLILEYQDVDDEIVVTIIPQVKFARRGGSGWVYVSMAELMDASRSLSDEVDITSPQVMIFEEANEEMVSQLRQALAARGLQYSELTDIDRVPVESGQRVNAIVETSIDDISLRCVAKVALNYLTKVAGIPLVVQRDFDPIRTYIRYGTHPNYPAVWPTRLPILQNDSLTQRHTNGHLVTVGWQMRHLVAQVSFFNFITYRIVLARNFSGVWRQIRSGHLFDIETRSVEPLHIVPGFP